MKIQNEFRVAASVERSWALLTDVPAITPCLPGAQLTDRDGDVYNGKMKVKVGPVTAEYTGTVGITELDENARRVLLSARGRETRGSGDATADIEVNMAPDDDGTRVSISTDLMVAGKVAQFGRGVLADVSKKLLDRFALCVEAKLAELAVVEPVEPSNPDGDSPEVPEASVPDVEPAPFVAERPADDASEDSLDLLDVAGSVLLKRLIPVGVVLACLVVVLSRRCRRGQASRHGA